MLPDTDKAGVQYLAREMLEAVWALQIEHKKSEFQYVTISLGISSVLVNSSMSQTELLTATDEALYRSKQKGRNCFS